MAMVPFVVPARSALLVVDMQVDFMPGGALAVASGDEIIEGVNDCTRLFFNAGAIVVLTQDWHPIGHASFASSHKGKRPFDPVDGAPGIGPILWPDHCIQGSPGANIHPLVDITHVHLILRKGFNEKVDSYSAFLENDKITPTGLAGYLREKNVVNVFICGLAYDYCVHYSAIDATTFGFATNVLVDLSRAVGSPPDIVDAVNAAYADHHCRLLRFRS